MDKLLKAREIINEVDREIAALFVKRMDAVKEVARYKEERGLPIFDATREKEVLAKAGNLVSDDTFAVTFFYSWKS